MTQYTKPSILHGIHHGDVASIRRVMNALVRRLSGVTEDAAANMSGLDDNEAEIVNHIMAIALSTPRNDLLIDMTSRFASARYQNTNGVLRAARDFDAAAVESVQHPIPGSSEYHAAENTFQQLIQSGGLAYRRNGDEEHGDVAHDSDYEASDEEISEAASKQDGQQPMSDRMYGRVLGKIIIRKNNGYGKVKEEDEAPDGKKSTADSWPGPHYKTDPRQKKHTPIRPSSCRAIDDGSYDRRPAKVGVRDDSKLSMTFRLQKEEPVGSGTWIPAGKATYIATRNVDWNDKESVAKLNAWRQGNFTRQIGAKNEARHVWLESERDVLVDIVERDLARPEAQGRWSYVQWDKVLSRYTATMQGRFQLVGEMSAQRERMVNGEVVPSASQPLKANRGAPTRSKGALKNQIHQFTDPRTRKMIQDAKNADENDNAEDTGEEEFDKDEIEED